MNMLKFGYGMVLDGLPDIPEFHFWNVWKYICLEAKHVGTHLMGQLKMCHLNAEKNKSSWMFTEPDTISLFRLLMYMYFLFILLPHFVLIMYVPIL